MTESESSTVNAPYLLKLNNDVLLYRYAFEEETDTSTMSDYELQQYQY